jgi:hypothetical protein
MPDMPAKVITEYELQVRRHARSVWPLLDKQHQSVLLLIVERGPIRQDQIAHSAPFLGAHPQHDKSSLETTTRQVRQLVRDLRVIHGVTILSSRAGYRLSDSRESTEAYLNAKYGSAIASGRAAMETYEAMRRSDPDLQDRPVLFAVGE